jgi:RNA polymerase sigma-70 factor, ECF subfamily
VWDFDKIYRAHVGLLFRYAVSLAGSRAVAEDVTSDTFLALYRNREMIEEDRLPAWLFTVAKNGILDRWRPRSTEQQYCQQWREQGGPVTPPFKPELLRHKGLKPVHRACLTLRCVHAMKRQEIAN